jgi:hypothetical protein
MKFELLSLMATVLCSAAATAAADEWTSMFNGKDLSGWKSNAATEHQPASVLCGRGRQCEVQEFRIQGEGQNHTGLQQRHLFPHPVSGKRLAQRGL